MAKDKDKLEIGKTGIFQDDSIPVIGGKVDQKKVEIIKPESEAPPVLNERGEEKFARKPNEIATLDPDITSKMRVVIPPIYYWEDVESDGTSSMMTMAFRWNGGNWGMSYPIDDQNYVKISMQRKKLFQVVKETLDVLIHHGTKVLDKSGTIDPALVNDEEAIRWKHDKYWDKKVSAFNHLVRIAPITKEKAVKLKLLEDDKIYK